MFANSRLLVEVFPLSMFCEVKKPPSSSATRSFNSEGTVGTSLALLQYARIPLAEEHWTFTGISVFD
jgi:hypothetical protein